jgi:arsenate reductase-like glutaredoxin family protein
MILYGIPTCDSCKKALKALEAAGRKVSFRDIRATPLSDAEISEIVREFGEAVINKQSTTWRGFSDFLKLAEPEAQIAGHPRWRSLVPRLGRQRGGQAGPLIIPPRSPA